MSDLKNRLESILFASGKALNVEELSRLTRERDLEVVRKALFELQQELEEKKGSVMLVNDEDEWKLNVREKYLPFIRKIVTKTELPKTIVETLAIVAFKSPVLQSKVIHIRTNKAYKHLDFLEEKGYITREKKGRTKLIKLTQKFFEYFDVPPDKLKEKFKGFEELDTAIEKMEEPKEVDLLDDEGHKVKLKEYDTESEVEPYTETPSPVEEYSEKVGELETYGEKKEKKKKKKHKKKEEKKEKPKEEEKPEKKEEEEEFEPPTEEELTAALTGAEAEEEAPEEEKVEEEAEEVEDVAEKVKEAAQKAEEVIKQVAEKPDAKLEEKPKEEEKPAEEKPEEVKEEKAPKEKKKEEVKEEVKEEEPKPEPRKKISAREIHEQARKLAEETERAPPEYATEGIFKGEMPKELKEKISQRAEEIAYGKKEEIATEEKRTLSFDEKPELPKEEKKE